MNVQDRIQAVLAQRIMVGDGAIGTMLYMYGLVPEYPPEIAVLEKPAWVEEIHCLYREVGSDFITTNTFGANRSRLSIYGLSNHFETINRLAVKLAKKASSSKTLVAASIGPTGEGVKSREDSTTRELMLIYREQIEVLKKAGADFAIVETMIDLEELQAAAQACRLEGFPFMVSMVFDEKGRPLAGGTPKTFVKGLESYNPLALGANCGIGFNGMTELIKELFLLSSRPILAQPSAGLPDFIAGKISYPISPDDFAAKSIALVKAGAAIVGGCCGSTPDHITSLKQAVKNLKPRQWRCNR
ncbi:MAG: homocysteine S-methyltransferase family protein [bacterium]